MGGVAGDVRQVVHVAGTDGPALPVENGQPIESFEPGETVVVFSGADWLPASVSLPDATTDALGYVQQFDEALANRTATTVGSIATPKGETLGQALNPAATLSPGELVESEDGRALLRESGYFREAGLDGTLEFLGVVPAGERPTRFLGSENTVESFAGVARSDGSLRLVLLHVVRAEVAGDVVFLAGVMHRSLLAATGETVFGGDHVADVASALRQTDLASVLLDGPDPLVTEAGLAASAAEITALAPEFDRPASE